MFKLALRNLWRNPKRSGITIAAVAIGIWALVFMWGFIDGMNEQMIVNNIQYMTGHLKIHQQGFHEDKELALSVSANDPRLNAILDDQRIEARAPRVEGPALISSADQSDTVMVFGIEPNQEAKLTAFDDALIAGQFFSSINTADNRDIIVGDKLAEQLTVGVGDRLDVIVQAADGSLGADRFTVLGIYDSGIDVLDENFVLMQLPASQELYSLWGQYTSWVIRSHDRQRVDALKTSLTDTLGTDFEVYDWQQLLPSVVQSIIFHERVAYIVVFVVFTVVAAGIANTILMAVMERTREFGVMLALGTEGRQIIGMVLIEVTLLGVIGLILGNGLGISFTAYWAKVGMDLSNYTEAMETMPGLSAIVYPLIRLDHLLIVSAVVFVICLLPALAPAWRSARLHPVDAIRGLNVHDGWAEKLESRLSFRRGVRAGGERARFLMIAWRNSFRNPKRSLLTAGATGFGMAAFVFLYAFADGFFEQMINNSTKLLTSHVQIAGADNKSTTELTLIREDGITELIQNVQQNNNDAVSIQAWTPRLKMEAIASSASKALPIEWYGVDPIREQQVTELQNFIVEGAYLNDQPPNSVIIGHDLAEELNLELGHKLIVTLQSDRAELLSTALRIGGIFNSGSELFDKGYIFTADDDLRSLLSVPPQQFHHVALRLQDRHESQIAASLINQTIQDNDSLPSTWIAESWEDIMPVLVQMVEMSRMDFYLILAIVFVVVAMGVMNTLLMSVLERTHEFGLLLALGTQASQVLRTVIYEAVILGAIGVGIGALLGMAIAQYYHLNGIDLSSLVDSMAAIPGMTDQVFPTLIPENLLLPGLLLYLIGIIVAVYPARKAAFMKPVEALHHA